MRAALLLTLLGGGSVAAQGLPERRCVPAGVLVRGRRVTTRADERPEHRVSVRAFCMDETLVTRASFARYVVATGYVTEAERRGFGFESLEGFQDWAWQRVPHGSWRRPFSEDNADTRSFLRDDAPVTMVSWDDAVAYCAWRGGRLPTEAEWEYAMRAGSYRTRYPWGDAPDDASGRPRLNYWQGTSHARNERRDGWVYVSPVRAYPPNAWGFYDPVGNVWQWTADVFYRDTYAATALGHDAGAVAGAEERVVRGGSWWCAACTCEGYGLWYRGHNVRDARFNNLGFRCVYEAVSGRPPPPA